jgi:glycosyltransferase involved in cell wall biosynthesis
MKGCVTFHNDIFTPWPATSIIHPVQVMLEAGHSVTVISWDKGRGVVPKEATLPVKRIQVKVPVKGPLTLLRFSSELASAIINESPDFIMAFDLEVLRGSAIAARKLRVPLLYFAREDWPAMVRGQGGISSFLKSIAFAYIERTTCRRYVEHAYSVNPERGEKFVKWGIPYTTIYTTRGLSELPPLQVKHGRFSVAFAGSMLELQALPYVIRAMKGLDCDLILIGGDEKNIARAREIIANAEEKVSIKATGHIPQDIDYYREVGKCHIGLSLPVNTDRNKFFGISVKFWDYMSMGLPQIASNLPAMARILKGEGNVAIGRTVDPYSPDEIRSALLFYMNNREEMVRQGKEARRLFEEKYCWDVQKEKLKASHRVFRK